MVCRALFTLAVCGSLFAGTCYARPIDVSVVYVNAPGAMRPADARLAIEMALGVMRAELGLDMRIARERIRTDKYPQFAGLDPWSRQRRLNAWEKWFRRRGDPEEINLVMLPPLEGFGKSWLAGVANGICTFRRIVPVAHVNAQTMNLIGELRVWHVAYTVAHELGHLLGATHDISDNPPTIMHPNVLYFAARQLLHFSRISKREVRACL